jgi:putative ABC transport system substrate-binding protein
VLKSWDLPEYNVALNEFTDVLIRYGLDCRTLILTVMDKTEGVESLKKEIRIFKPDIILTVGSRATEIAAENFKNTPIIFSMVLYPVASNFVKSMDHPGGNVTGAAIDIPLRRQFQLLSRIVPGLERVGVLYSPEETQPVIDEARRVAQSMGLNLIVEKIESESNVPEALSNLERQNIQAIWSVADGKVFTAQSTRYIIEQAVRREIPFMGPYNGFVRAGALVALTANYRDNGRQAAEIAIRVLNGANPATIPVATPQKVEMALNLRVASHIKVRIPESIVEQADQVFE